MNNIENCKQILLDVADDMLPMKYNFRTLIRSQLTIEREKGDGDAYLLIEMEEKFENIFEKINECHNELRETAYK